MKKGLKLINILIILALLVGCNSGIKNENNVSASAQLIIKDGRLEGLTDTGRMASEIVIPDSVKIIGEKAFYNCTRLTKITIPSSVEKIEADAFMGCDRLKSITLPESIKEIGNGAFT